MNNIAAMNANRILKHTNCKVAKTMEKIASGLRINRAGDDAAGLSISEKMRGQIRGMQAATQNVLDGISLLQTAEGALNEQHVIVERMKELSVQAANGTYVLKDREAISREVSRLLDELDNIVQNTQFNTTKLFLGLDTTPITIMAGENLTEQIDILIKKSIIPSFGYFAWEAPAVLVGGPGADIIVDLTTNTNAGIFLTATDTAIKDLSVVRSSLGAYQNRLEHIYANLNNGIENLTAAESRIRDADMAKEMANVVKNQILQQAGTAMLAQANQQPERIIPLLSA